MTTLEIHKRRYHLTKEFIEKFINKNDIILDVGVRNSFSSILEEQGYNVKNTTKIDFDFHPEIVQEIEVDAVVALEILEHLVSPFTLLRNLPGKKLIATVPLKLWFASAYKNPNDKWDCHFHEFEDWQFDWLLEKSGWKIIHREKWKSPSNKIGFRPFLRKITPRYYAVYAEREN